MSTKAKIAPPPKPKMGYASTLDLMTEPVALKPEEGSEPADQEGAKIVNDNMKTRDSDLFVDLNFKVRPQVKTEFKISATAAGLSMKQLLMVAYDLWKVESAKGNPEVTQITRRVKALEKN